MRILVCALLIGGCLLACKHESKFPEYEKPLNDFLHAEKKDFVKQEKIAVVVLHASDCSCKDANVKFLYDLKSDKTVNYRLLYVLKNDFGQKVAKKLELTKGDEYLLDSTDVIEKYGNIITTDKVFIIDKGELTNVLEVEERKFKQIKNSLM